MWHARHAASDNRLCVAVHAQCRLILQALIAELTRINTTAPYPNVDTLTPDGYALVNGGYFSQLSSMAGQ